jgi:hypothetical protein
MNLLASSSHQKTATQERYGMWTPALLFALIHPSAWNKNSANFALAAFALAAFALAAFALAAFALAEFSEVQQSFRTRALAGGLRGPAFCLLRLGGVYF